MRANRTEVSTDAVQTASMLGMKRLGIKLGDYRREWTVKGTKKRTIPTKNWCHQLLRPKWYIKKDMSWHPTDLSRVKWRWSHLASTSLLTISPICGQKKKKIGLLRELSDFHDSFHTKERVVLDFYLYLHKHYLWDVFISLKYQQNLVKPSFCMY